MRPAPLSGSMARLPHSLPHFPRLEMLITTFIQLAQSHPHPILPTRYHNCHCETDRADTLLVRHGTSSSCATVTRSSSDQRGTGAFARSSPRASASSLGRGGCAIPADVCVRRPRARHPWTAGRVCSTASRDPHPGLLPPAVTAPRPPVPSRRRDRLHMQSP